MNKNERMQAVVEDLRTKNAKANNLPKALVAAIIEAQAELGDQSPTECERTIATLVIAHLDSEVSK